MSAQPLNENRLFINGEFVPSVSGKTFDLTNPTTEEKIGSVYEAGAEDVDLAVEAAKAAFPAWSALSAEERCDYLIKLADEIEKNEDLFMHLEAIAMGMPQSGTKFVIQLAKRYLRYFGTHAIDITGETSLNTTGYINLSIRQPYGVCGGIIPWNAPLFMIVTKLGPALAAGNTMVVKSSEKSPFASIVVGLLCQNIGLPKGVLNILNGFGRPCGEAIAKHMDIRRISFTGSVATGRAIHKASAESNLKDVSLELGGKSPLLVFDDAPLEKTVMAAAFSILYNSGQVCMASTRIYVQEGIAPKFIEALKGAMLELGVPGDPLLASTKRGPQVDKLQFDRVLSFLDHAKEKGYDIALGGNKALDKGYFVDATIVRDVPENDKLIREEIFGPVLVINTFTDEDEVLKRANDTEFGLYSSVFTSDISRALRVVKSLEAGAVGVNCTSPFMAIDMPMGGWKQSGAGGREFSKACLETWTQLKSVFISL
ncbi:aldehyde dehydrogenase [Fusarium redolens]|uniref:aldehyde dehydrogenase (NAD(+)) n=1 Tax=Fusarium redolens TaxID=48865 RepID=A0A9P9JR49_FUSRE|nr:aldehyde dehydrogenase [Fusarium redolens]KAH7233893.1 aldehyde dehydrogenase [Fusarium redolens]